MADDTTGTWQKPADIKPAGESKIFNTSIRGWIALILGAALAIAFCGVIFAPYFDVEMPKDNAAAILVLFSGSAGGAMAHYFNQQSKEGQK